MTERFKKATADLIGVERGYNDVEADHGGATKYGISLAWYRRAVDPHATKDTIRALTPERAESLYWTYFWIPSRAAELPEHIGEAHFINYVNMDPRDAGRVLQRAISRAGVHVDVDGIVGHHTIQAAQRAPLVELKRRIVAELCDFYHEICKAQPDQDRAFSNGWFYRAATLFIH